jgi:hypothetical protein
MMADKIIGLKELGESLQARRRATCRRTAGSTSMPIRLSGVEKVDRA